MTISSGSRVGPYEILTPIGAGGMGEVYRARDSRLGREVAVKALSDEFAADPGRMSRFETEARAASALNHPSIVTIHEVGRSNGTPYIVMELVEGRTLRDILYAGALPPRRALNLAAQLADALAEAHRVGIVHRDLKPENVMVTRDGLAKILDFGLAIADGLGGGERRSDLTLTESRREGSVIGTSAYMSPEQASGQAIDFRSDQFSFGSLVYEMLTGRRAFQKGTRVETLAAVIREDPEPILVLAPKAPAPLRWIVERCLAKSPEERYASTRDLARDLQSVRDHFSEIDAAAAFPGVPAHASRRPRKWLAPGLALAVVALVAAAYVAGTGARSPKSPSFHRLTFRDGTIWSARFAPDGRTVLYGAAWGRAPIQIFAMRPESPESAPLPLPPANLLAVSSTGEMAISVGARPIGAFRSRGTLARTSLAGGEPREVLESVEAADWSPDGGSLAVVRMIGAVDRLEYPIAHEVYETSSGYLSDPRVSPRGDLVAFVDHPVRGDDSGSVAVLDRDGRRRTLSSGWISLRGLAWSPDGSEVWFSAAAAGDSRALYAVSLSGRRRLLARAPGALTLRDVSSEGRALVAREHWRQAIVGLSPGDRAERDLSWHDWSRPVDVTPDGTAMLFDETGEAGGSTYAVYYRRTDGSPAVRLGDGHALALSPDRKWALSSPHRVPAELVMLPTGPGQPRSIRTGRFENILRAAWLPGGDRLLLAASEPGHGTRLYVQSASGGDPRAVTPEGVSTSWAISSDGARFVAIAPDGQLAAYPVGGGAPQPLFGSRRGDVPIRFSPDGRFLYLLVRGEGPAVSIERLALETGARERWKEIAVEDPVGVYGIPRVFLSADGESYVYTYVRLLDELYLVDGLR
jgi:serine/threonine protein kinase/Tol biopolymer transport system component